MKADDRKGAAPRPVPYPSWTAIAAEVTPAGGPAPQPRAKDWWDLLAEDAPPAPGPAGRARRER